MKAEMNMERLHGFIVKPGKRVLLVEIPIHREGVMGAPD
jgi:hypothetical protein